MIPSASPHIRVHKAVAHALVSALLSVPMAGLAMTGLVLVPAVGRTSDDFWGRLAGWHGYRLPAGRGDAVDWRTWLCAAGQAVLGLLSVVALPLGALLTGGFAVMAVRPRPMDIFGWHTTGALTCLALAVLTVLMLLFTLGLAWLVAAGSTLLWVQLTQTRLAVEDLTRSRAVLTDSFSAERRRIERELHDGVQQYLTASQLALATARIAARGDEAVLAAIATAQENTTRAVAALRTTIRGIHPQVLDELGLTEAVRELVALSGLHGTVRAAGMVEDQQLDSSAALLLYHAVAEAMTNAVKHGGAASVDVTITWRALDVEVDVRNDGSTPTTELDGSGTGLQGLRERAEVLGGGLSFGAREDGTGARLTVSAARVRPDAPREATLRLVPGGEL